MSNIYKDNKKIGLEFLTGRFCSDIKTNFLFLKSKFFFRMKLYPGFLGQHKAQTFLKSPKSSYMVWSLLLVSRIFAFPGRPGVGEIAKFC